MSLKRDLDYYLKKDYAMEPYRYDVMVPGPALDVSVGLAIGHAKSPLQDLVREAQAAEKRAKRELGGGSVAITLQKRSGETVLWGSPWEQHHNQPSPHPALSLLEQIADLIRSGELENGFPGKAIAFFSPYLGNSAGENSQPYPQAGSIDPEFRKLFPEILTAEFQHCLSQRLNNTKKENLRNQNRALEERFAQALSAPLVNPRSDPDPPPDLPEASPSERLKHLCDLLRVAAWMARNRKTPGNDNRAAQPIAS
ncbi:MAG: hypothetical protein ACQKBT_01075 [Puniceicoccales bacterium]